MGTKRGNRIAFRIFLILLLIAAALNTMYVYKYDTSSAPSESASVQQIIEQKEKQQVYAPSRPWFPPPGLVRPRERDGTEGWHGDIEAMPQPDGSYSFIVRSGNYDHSLPISSFEAWITKAGSKEEKKVELQPDSQGLVTKIAFPEKGEWIMRVRLTSGNNSLEFSQRVTVK